MPIVM